LEEHAGIIQVGDQGSGMTKDTKSLIPDPRSL
jgi:hypothetical protein